MPHSHPEGRGLAAEWVAELRPARIVDLGAGAGAWRRALDRAAPGAHWTAVEVWGPYIDQFGLRDRYDVVLQQDARTVDWAGLAPDLVVCGDVLEHMTTDEACALVTAARAVGAAVLVSVPIVYYPQGEAHGNPYERHVRDDYTHDEVLALWSPVKAHAGEVVGTYLVV